MRMCTASAPAPLRTKAALSLPCFLACYNRALLSGSKSPFQSPARCTLSLCFPCQGGCSPAQPVLVPIPVLWGSRGPGHRVLGAQHARLQPAASSSAGGSTPATSNYQRCCCRHMIWGRQQSVSLLMTRCMCRGWGGCQGERLECWDSALSQPHCPTFSESPVPPRWHKGEMAQPFPPAPEPRASVSLQCRGGCRGAARPPESDTFWGCARGRPGLSVVTHGDDSADDKSPASRSTCCAQIPCVGLRSPCQEAQ